MGRLSIDLISCLQGGWCEQKGGFFKVETGDRPLIIYREGLFIIQSMSRGALDRWNNGGFRVVRRKEISILVCALVFQCQAYTITRSE
jgi:hypothetical protein